MNHNHFQVENGCAVIRLASLDFAPLRDCAVRQGNGPVQLKLSEWDDLPGNIMAQNSYIRCCWRGKKQPLVVQELHLADLLGVLTAQFFWE